MKKIIAALLLTAIIGSVGASQLLADPGDIIQPKATQYADPGDIIQPKSMFLADPGDIIQPKVATEQA